ncbi:hypothetical protein PAXRUDRAFT_834603 [Paxillus rubicundulus Ve08.2h10]|uniref:Uncharacterized protein n=1 Tax=Paxillus rubicundulus Ve08.2h10 TaxID=930991 RepID=A0A0D0CSH7_9AGAM|nr:hypothetical protein PAXRUDRAFT_834603 [Paxillus rubicundulus Ve08.2h10]
MPAYTMSHYLYSPLDIGRSCSTSLDELYTSIWVSETRALVHLVNPSQSQLLTNMPRVKLTLVLALVCTSSAAEICSWP